MSTAYEKVESRKSKVGANQPTGQLVYIIKGTEDDGDANQTLQLAIPLIYPGASYVQLLYQDYTIEHKGGGVWEATVNYARQDSLYTFEIGGGKKKVTQALLLLDTNTAAGTTAPDLGTIIGWDGKKVNGAEINSAEGHWEETFYFPPARAINDDYQQALRDMAWTLNSASFRGRSAGEVLFMGARGSQRGANNIEISFKFAYQADQFDVNFGPVNCPHIGGWDLVDILYQPSVDPVSKLMIPRPTVVRLLRVYEYSDFTQLGIGS